MHIRHLTASGSGTFVTGTHKVVATLILVVLCYVGSVVEEFSLQSHR